MITTTSMKHKCHNLKIWKYSGLNETEYTKERTSLLNCEHTADLNEMYKPILC